MASPFSDRAELKAGQAVWRLYNALTAEGTRKVFRLYLQHGDFSGEAAEYQGFLLIAKELHLWAAQLGAEMAFRKFDKDGNGFISAEELKKGMLESLDKGIHKMMMNAA